MSQAGVDALGGSLLGYGEQQTKVSSLFFTFNLIDLCELTLFMQLVVQVVNKRLMVFIWVVKGRKCTPGLIGGTQNVNKQTNMKTTG